MVVYMSDICCYEKSQPINNNIIHYLTAKLTFLYLHRIIFKLIKIDSVHYFICNTNKL